MAVNEVVVYDFDGTLTKSDSLLGFIRYACGSRAMLCGFLRHLPLLMLMKLHCYPNYKAKQQVFSYFFRGMDIRQFDGLCRRYAATHRQILRPQGVASLAQDGQAGRQVVIVSASVDNWVQPFFPGVCVLGTQVEVRDGRLTGRFLTPNCYGQEKVRRLLERFPDRAQYQLTAYGDSRGDREMLAFADEAHYKPFRR